MKKLLLFIFLLASASYAQPINNWVRFYDGHNNADEALDVFPTMDGGFALGGYTYLDNGVVGFLLIKTDDNGGEEWQSTFLDERFPGLNNWCHSLIQTDDGGYLLGGECQAENREKYFSVLRSNSEGERIWWSTYTSGMNWASCEAVIELKSGEYIAAGRNPDFEAYAVMLDGDGDVIWENTFDDGAWFHALRETQGGLLFAGWSSGHQGWLLKTNFNGEVEWSETYGEGSFSSIISCQDGGFAVCGHCLAGDLNDCWLVRVADNGDQDWSRTFDFGGNEWFSGIVQKPDQDFVLSICNQSYCDPAIICVDPAGNEQWHRTDTNRLDNRGSDEYNSIVTNVAGDVILAGVANRERDHRTDGVMVKLNPYRLAPLIIGHEPELLDLTILIDEVILFSVTAIDAQDDELFYLWALDENEVSQDSSVEITFDQLGQFELNCVVSDGNHISSITWHITVSDFFIRETIPDTLHITARRGSTLPFALDIACVEPDAPVIEWSVVNRDNDREYLGEADSIDVLFDLAGEWAVEAEAAWNGERESVRWAVDVRSAVWWWLPHEEAISVNQHERRDFSVFPFDPDSDSLSVAWWLDGDSLDCVAEALSLDFPDLGEHSLTSIVHDGIEADTIHWQITVNDGSSASDLPTTPTKLALYPPAPNPFNSTTTIGYSLPAAGNVSLTVYDLSGREVARLAAGVKAAGTHEAVWVADGVSSGVYVVKLVAGGRALMSKVVLVR